jgi:pimeloyl-ACP methyl ester carboxylesterase
MRTITTGAKRLGLAAAMAGLAAAMFAPAASAGGDPDVRFTRIKGYDEPSTPARYDRVGILEVGPRNARNILVLNPGTSASAAYFAPVMKTIVRRAPGWQVWAVERRENLLEDHSMLNRAKRGRATPRQLQDYYLGWVSDPSIKKHFQTIPDSRVGFGRQWGMRTQILDLRRVMNRATARGRRVVLGGHSLGGTITTAYATWDFNGRPGARDLDGLVYIDGGSSPTPITEERARAALQNLQNSTPWLTFGGIPAPYTGLFNSSGSALVRMDPNGPSLGQQFPALPADLKPPIPVTNEAQYGYALDTDTSPPGLVAAQAHLGRLASSGNPRGWVRAGELTPSRRYADMFSGWGLMGLDGTAWYHPQRLTIDAGAVAAGNANPAQRVLGVRATHGRNLPRRLRIYAFGASLGGQRVLTGAEILADQSRIPRRNLTLVNRASTYAHNDPNSAFPKNAFLDRLVPFLRQIRRS